MILLASTMDGLDLSRSRVMVAAVQSLAFYCFPLLTGLLLHVMRQRDHDSYLLRRQHERGETARSLHDTIGNDLAYLILRIDHAETEGMPADEHEYQQQPDELRDAASRAMGHTHEVIDSLENHPQRPSDPSHEGSHGSKQPRTADSTEVDGRRAACRAAIADRRGGGQARSPGIHRRQPARRTTPAAHAGDHATAGGPAVEPAGGTVREHRQTRHPGEWYAICVTFDTDAIHVSASDTITPDDTRLGLDRYQTIIETHVGTFQTHTEQAHWQLEAGIPIDGGR